MTPAEHAALPDRVHLAKTLLAHTHGGRGYDVYVPRAGLYRYVTAAEDTIEAQAAMLRDDLADFTRLRTENASLRQLVEAALIAGQLGDPTAITTIREALERTA